MSKKCQYFHKFMSEFQKNINISANVCQYLQKHVNISINLCQDFKKMSILHWMYVQSAPGVAQSAQEARVLSMGRTIHLRPGPPRILVIYIYIYSTNIIYNVYLAFINIVLCFCAWFYPLVSIYVFLEFYINFNFIIYIIDFLR